MKIGGAEGGSTSATDESFIGNAEGIAQAISQRKKTSAICDLSGNFHGRYGNQYPTTLEELEKISGVSKGKALRYGKRFVEMIAQYVEENDIVKPDDFVMRSVVNKSSNKVFIIQKVDKKMPLETIAKGKDMRIEQLLEEMETIVASGTKLNLNYAIDEMVDEDDQQDILDYFKSCETSSLDVAREELSDLQLRVGAAQNHAHQVPE